MFLAILPLLLMPAQAAENNDKAAVLSTVQRLFDAMSARDVAAAKEVILSEGQYIAVREKPVPGSLQAFAERLGTGSGKLLERIWNPQVSMHGRIASVWAPYDFHRDGKFSHCGVDSIGLVKTEAGWKIASVMWTQEPTGCQPSPLGPPKP